MATHQECIHSKLCAFRQDLCVTENLQNVDKECSFFEQKKCGQWEDNGRCTYCGAFSVSHGADYCSNCGADMLRTPKERGVDNGN